MTKLYMLYEAVDMRDNKPMLWLIDVKADRVVLFKHTTPPSYVKRLTAAAPDILLCESSKVLEHAHCSRNLISTWEF